MKILKSIVLFLIVVFLAYFLSPYAGEFYGKFFPSGSIASVNFGPVIGFPLAYIFFLVFMFTIFGDTKKYWWIGILLIPAALFEISFDWQHIYIPIILGLVGWGIGFGITKLLSMKKTV